MLKLALLRAKRPQYEIAREMGWSESRLCRVLYGRITPSADESSKLVRLLDMTPEEAHAAGLVPATALHVNGGRS